MSAAKLVLLACPKCDRTQNHSIREGDQVCCVEPDCRHVWTPTWPPSYVAIKQVPWPPKTLDDCRYYDGLPPIGQARQIQAEPCAFDSCDQIGACDGRHCLSAGGKIRLSPEEQDDLAAATAAAEQLAKLRELRLWHYRAGMRERAYGISDHRTAADLRDRPRPKINVEPDYLDASSKKHHDAADQHFKFVQTLNDFFPADDTAERDAAKVGQG